MDKLFIALWLVGCILSVLVAFLLWKHMDKVREKKWFLGWLGYLFLITFSYICYSHSGLPLP